MGILLTEDAAAAAGSSVIMVGYIVVLVVVFYFIMVRPQKKEQKRMAAMLSELSVGDAVLTNSGFYAEISDCTGRKTGCRIRETQNKMHFGASFFA